MSLGRTALHSIGGLLTADTPEQDDEARPTTENGQSRTTRSQYSWVVKQGFRHPLQEGTRAA